MARIHRIGSPETGSQAGAIKPLAGVAPRLAGARRVPVTSRRAGASGRIRVSVGEPLPEPTADRLESESGEGAGR